MRSCQTQLWWRPKTYAEHVWKKSTGSERFANFTLPVPSFDGFEIAFVLDSVDARAAKVKVLRTNATKNKLIDLSGSRCKQLIQNKITRATNKFNLFRASLQYLSTGTEKYFHISFCRVPC